MNASPGRFASDLESSLGPLGGHKVHKSVKFCIVAGTAPCHEAIVARASRP